MASIDVEVDGDKTLHKSINDAISDADITAHSNPKVHAVLVHAGRNTGNTFEPDWSDLSHLSIKKSK